MAMVRREDTTRLNVTLAPEHAAKLTRLGVSVAIDGKTYFGAGDAYASTLRMNAAARTAVDPSTSKKIDKASAVTFADASGRVFYFESESSYREFIGLATPETVYGYSAPR